MYILGFPNGMKSIYFEFWVGGGAPTPFHSTVLQVFFYCLQVGGYKYLPSPLVNVQKYGPVILLIKM